MENNRYLCLKNISNKSPQIFKMININQDQKKTFKLKKLKHSLTEIDQNRAMTTPHQKYPKDNEFFAELAFRQGIFLQLFKIEACEQNFQFFETIPADFLSPDDIHNHNKNKELHSN